LSSSKESFQEYFPLLTMAGLILVVQLLALILSMPMEVNNMQAFEDPTQVSNSIYYILLILVFTLLVLIAIKKNMKWLITLFIYFAVFSTLYYVFFALFTFIPALLGLENLASLLLSLGLTALLYKHPEWYVIDLLGICIAGGVSALIGISLSITPVVILLLLLAIYDAISVYKTKHMITMAEGIMDLKLPILFVIPKSRNYSFRQESFKEGEKREAFFMGLGDAVMPTLLVVSANVFMENGRIFSVVGAMIGTIIGYMVLSVLVMKGKPQAGLPFLNTGAILGFYVGFFLSGI
jgi:presenilin-like A22 family membrane protease